MSERLDKQKSRAISTCEPTKITHMRWNLSEHVRRVEQGRVGELLRQRLKADLDGHLDLTNQNTCV